MKTGDFVIWNSSGGKARGKITRIEDNGTINIPNSSFTVKGTKEDPAALIRVYQKQDNGYEPSDTLVGHKLSTLTQIDGLPEPSAKRNQMFVDAIDMAVAILDQAKESYEMEEEYPTEEGVEAGMEADQTNDYYERSMTDTMQWVATDINEKRSIVYSNLELRAESDGNTIVGYAAIWDSPSEPMPFIEYVKRGAFSKTLNDGADVRLLVDHEGVPLARTKSGTLTLEEDDRGLRMEAKLDPSNPDAARMISAMRRGDLSQMSFAFRTVKDQWSSDRMTRELREVQLFDVSLVTFPAYEETVAELRTKREPVTVIPTSRLLLRKNQLAIQRIHSR